MGYSPQGLKESDMTEMTYNYALKKKNQRISRYDSNHPTVA